MWVEELPELLRHGDQIRDHKGSTIGNILISSKLIRAMSIYHAASRYSNYRDRPIQRKQFRKKSYVYHYIGSMHCVLK